MVVIINQLEDGFEVIRPNIPFEEIKNFVAEHATKLETEDEDDEDYSVIDYIKEEYPDFYESGNSKGMFDEAFLGGIGILAEDFDKTEEEVIDMIIDMVRADDPVLGAMGIVLATEAVALAREKWIEQNQ